MDTVEKGVAMAVDYMEEWCERETERDGAEGQTSRALKEFEGRRENSFVNLN